MINAMVKFGYKLTVLRGYLFEQAIIFKDSVNSLYEIECNSKQYFYAVGHVLNLYLIIK
jgi:hypothetical protein